METHLFFKSLRWSANNANPTTSEATLQRPSTAEEPFSLPLGRFKASRAFTHFLRKRVVLPYTISKCVTRVHKRKKHPPTAPCCGTNAQRHRFGDSAAADTDRCSCKAEKCVKAGKKKKYQIKDEQRARESQSRRRSGEDRLQAARREATRERGVTSEKTSRTRFTSPWKRQKEKRERGRTKTSDG